MTDLEQFTTACIAALYFTDTGEISEGQPPADAPLDADTKLNLEADCRSFWHRMSFAVVASKKTAAEAGHDFWLTRNGHGAGFWDGDWPEPFAAKLDEAAQNYGEFDTYLCDHTGEVVGSGNSA
jgi:hypothetical protein